MKPILNSNFQLKTILYHSVLLFLSFCIGMVVFLTINEEIPVLLALVLFCFLVTPYIFIWPDLAQKIFLGVLILTLPLTVDQTFFLRDHYGGAQGLVVSVNGIAIIILWILYAWRRMIDSDSMKFHTMKPFSIILPGLTLVCILSMIPAVDRMYSLYEMLEIIKMILIFYYIANYISETGNTRYVLIFLIGGLFLESIIALLQLVTGSSLNLRVLGGRENLNLSALGNRNVFRIGGTLGNANSLALYLNFVIMIPLALMLQKTKLYWKLILFVIFILSSITMLFSYSRAGWISYFIGIGLVLIFKMRRVQIILRTYLIIIILLAVGIGTTLLWILPNPITDRLLADDRGSAYVRIPLMKVAVTIMKERPILGIGLNNYSEVDHLYDHTPEQVSHFFPFPVHNVFLQIGAEIGIVGLLIFFLFLYYVFKQAILIVRYQDYLSQALIIGIISGFTGFIVIGIVENASMGSYHLFPLWFLSGLVAGLYHRKRFILSSESK